MSSATLTFLLLAGATVLLGLLVLGGRLDTADTALLARRRQRGEATRMTTALRDLTALGGDTLRVIFLVGCIVGLSVAGRAAVAALLLGGTALVRGGLVLLKRGIRRARPDPAQQAIVTHTTSFPSGHTLMATMLYLTAALLIPAPGGAMQAAAITCALAVSLIVGLTRFALGAHWPSDIVVGWLAGATCAVAMALLAQRLAL